MIRRAVVTSFLFVSAAWAGDGTDEKPKAAPEAGTSAELAPVRGIRYRMALRTGGSVSGIVIGDHLYERRDGTTWVAAEKGDPGAGARLFFVLGQDGFVFLPVKDIKSTEKLGDIDAKEGAGFAGQHVAAARRADAERERLHKERVARAEAAKAKAADDAEKSKTAEADKAKAPMLPEDQVARFTALLAKFPPGSKWTPDTKKEIERRVLLMDLFPDDTEKEFLSVFDEWLKAYAAWKAGQDKTAPTAAGK